MAAAGRGLGSGDSHRAVGGFVFGLAGGVAIRSRGLCREGPGDSPCSFGRKADLVCNIQRVVVTKVCEMIHLYVIKRIRLVEK